MCVFPRAGIGVGWPILLISTILYTSAVPTLTSGEPLDPTIFNAITNPPLDPSIIISTTDHALLHTISTTIESAIEPVSEIKTTTTTTRPRTGPDEEGSRNDVVDPYTRDKDLMKSIADYKSFKQQQDAKDTEELARKDEADCNAVKKDMAAAKDRTETSLKIYKDKAARIPKCALNPPAASPSAPTGIKSWLCFLMILARSMMALLLRNNGERNI